MKRALPILGYFFGVIIVIGLISFGLFRACSGILSVYSEVMEEIELENAAVAEDDYDDIEPLMYEYEDYAEDTVYYEHIIENEEDTTDFEQTEEPNENAMFVANVGVSNEVVDAFVRIINERMTYEEISSLLNITGYEYCANIGRDYIRWDLCEDSHIRARFHENGTLHSTSLANAYKYILNPDITLDFGELDRIFEQGRGLVYEDFFKAAGNIHGVPIRWTDNQTAEQMAWLWVIDDYVLSVTDNSNGYVNMWNGLPRTLIGLGLTSYTVIVGITNHRS